MHFDLVLGFLHCVQVMSTFRLSTMCNKYRVLMVTNIFPFFSLPSYPLPLSPECCPAFAFWLHDTRWWWCYATWLLAAINSMPNWSATCCYGSHSATLFCMFAYMIFHRKFPWCTVQCQLLCLQPQHLPQVSPSLQQPQPTRFANLQLPFLRTTLNQCLITTHSRFIWHSCWHTK